MKALKLMGLALGIVLVTIVVSFCIGWYFFPKIILHSKVYGFIFGIVAMALAIFEAHCLGKGRKALFLMISYFVVGVIILAAIIWPMPWLK